MRPERGFWLCGILVLLLIMFLLVPSASAQDGQTAAAAERAGVTPDNILYGLDVFFDEVMVFLTPNPLAKSELRLNIMQERMAEMEVMASRNKMEEMKRAGSEGQKQIDLVGYLVKDVRPQDVPKLNESLQRHTEELKGIRQRLMNIKESMLEDETLNVSGDDIDESIDNLFEMIETSENAIVHIGESWQDTFALQTTPRREIDWENMTDEEREAMQNQLDEEARIREEEQKEKFGFICNGGRGGEGGGNILTGERTQTEWCCYDSDDDYRHGDRHYYVKGTLRYKVINTLEGAEGEVVEYETHTDSCDGSSLTEWNCEGTDHRASEEFVCPKGCEDGACIDNDGVLSGIKELSEGEEGYLENCIDSDGGADYFVKGTLSTPEYNSTDFCRDESKVAEFSCGFTTVSDGEFVPVGVYYQCPDGCQDGACI